eukprot:Nk52_evm1s1394 gene=Nk52_evmTU1s1394
MNFQTAKQKQHILERPLPKGKKEISLNLFAFMFSEIVQYCQDRVESIPELEKRLSEIGYRVGARMLEVLIMREKNGKRELKLIDVLYFIHSTVWKSLFGKAADFLELDSENSDTYMISDTDLIVNSYISVPKELGSLNCGAFVAGIVEATLDGMNFSARVTAHTTEKGTTILMKFEPSVMARSKALEGK